MDRRTFLRHATVAGGALVGARFLTGCLPAVTLPASIDRTGRTDVTHELEDFLRALPRGATADLQGATLRVDGRMLVSGVLSNKPTSLGYQPRSGLTLAANDVTILGNHAKILHNQGPVPSDAVHWDCLRLHCVAGWTIADLEIEGRNADGDPYGVPPGAAGSTAREQQHAITIAASDDITIRNVHAHHVYGDGFYVGASYQDYSGATPRYGHPTNIRFLDCTIDNVGRQGIAVQGGIDIEIARCRFDRCRLLQIDLEAMHAAEWIDGVHIHGCDFGPWGGLPGGDGVGYGVLSATGAGGTDDVLIEDNTSRGQLRIRIASHAEAWPHGTRHDWVIRNNVDLAPSAVDPGGLISIGGPWNTAPAPDDGARGDRVRNFRIHGNRGPVRSGSPGAPAVAIRGNAAEIHVYDNEWITAIDVTPGYGSTTDPG